MFLVDFIIRIYHDAQPSECQIRFKIYNSFYSRRFPINSILCRMLPAKLHITVI